jgi:hypothetical protein
MDQRTFDARVEAGEFTVLKGPKGKKTEPEAVAASTVAPPRAGRGSGRAAWAEYAASKGVEVNDEMNRDDIIDAVEG